MNNASPSKGDNPVTIANSRNYKDAVKRVNAAAGELYKRTFKHFRPSRRIAIGLGDISLGRTIIVSMARGWESKSVEAQQSEAAEKSAQPRVKLSPEAAARTRERENLRLARQRVLQQLEQTQNARHRKLLQDTLADLDRKLSEFEER